MLAKQSVQMMVRNIRKTKMYEKISEESKSRVELVLEAAMTKVNVNGRLLPGDRELSDLLKLGNKFLDI